MIRARLFLLSSFLLLSACAGQSFSPPWDTGSEAAPTGSAGPTPALVGVDATQKLGAPVRVAILTPQSGPNAAVGEALVQAAQLAVFDLNEQNFVLIPKNTRGTPEGARAAVVEAAGEGAQLILGPLLAPEVTAARDAARPYGLTVIGFTTDWRVAGGNSFTMGVLPFGQAERMAHYAAKRQLGTVALIATRDEYGDAVTTAFTNAARAQGLTVSPLIRVASDGSDATAALQALSTASTIKGIFMPLGGPALKNVRTALNAYGMTPARVTFMGTGLWDDPSITADPAMQGAVYAAPAPALRTAFERNYQRTYGTMPPRLASIGYDAAALAIVMARNTAGQPAQNRFNQAALTNPNGFSGVDGIFRFKHSGLVERGMAVLQIQGQGPAQMVDAAPASFVGQP